MVVCNKRAHWTVRVFSQAVWDSLFLQKGQDAEFKGSWGAQGGGAAVGKWSRGKIRFYFGAVGLCTSAAHSGR